MARAPSPKLVNRSPSLARYCNRKIKTSYGRCQNIIFIFWQCSRLWITCVLAIRFLLSIISMIIDIYSIFVTLPFVSHITFQLQSYQFTMTLVASVQIKTRKESWNSETEVWTLIISPLKQNRVPCLFLVFSLTLNPELSDKQI